MGRGDGVATTALHRSALAMAIEQRNPESGLIHHTDRSAVYSAPTYRELLAQIGMQPSMNGRKTAYDNAFFLQPEERVGASS